MHVPLNRDAVRDTMPAFFDLLREEPHPAVRVVLGHFIFVYIHPFSSRQQRSRNKLGWGHFRVSKWLAIGGYTPS
jgi:hypothetical protein